ncbi:hypothetical protein U1Q18_007576, partial [Sarracenia purpurea var. burkii]
WDIGASYDIPRVRVLHLLVRHKSKVQSGLPELALLSATDVFVIVSFCTASNKALMVKLKAQ